jgi:hypothetical protein
MKRRGIAIPGYVFKDDKLVPAKKRMSVSERIRRNKSKRVTPKRGKRLP